jgi:hypothetical protein
MLASNGQGHLRTINTPSLTGGLAAMETEEFDDPADDDAVTAHRARARNLLPQITQQVRQALEEAGIKIDVFLMVPTTGDAVASFGTITDPPDKEWARVSEMVSAIVRQSVGLTHTRCREIACASTTDAITAAPQEEAVR